MTTGDVHWEEGLFLQPHHLQVMQRRLIDRIVAERAVLRPYNRGVLEAAISRDELANRLVRFGSLRAIMPSGLVVEVPEHADLAPLDIGEAFERNAGPITVFLGVPRWKPRRANTLSNRSAAARLYRVEELEVVDENTGDNAQPVRVRHLNARLLLEDDDDAAFERMPVLRIVPGVGDEMGTPREDPGFAPPCAVLQASPVLLKLCRDLVNAMEATHTALQDQMTRGDFRVETMRGLQFGQIMRLQTFARYVTPLAELIAAPATEPFEICVRLQALLGELSALEPQRRKLEIPRYDHDDPLPVFANLCSRIKEFLTPVVPAAVLKVPFVREPQRFAAQLSAELMARAAEYYLGVKSRLEPSGVATLVQNIREFKLMPASHWDQAYEGISLVKEEHPPLQFPREAGLQFFRLVRDRGLWSSFIDEKSLTARWAGWETGDFELSLYIIPVEKSAEAT